MSLDTYANLKTAIGVAVDRDVSSWVDDWIDAAEARHKREIRIREMLVVEDIAIAENDRTVVIPARFLDHKYFRIFVPNATSGRRFFPDLQEVTLDELSRRSIYDGRRPLCYALHEVLEFDSKADQDYDAEWAYFTSLLPLDNTNTSNAILARAPDCYLYAVLVEAVPFLNIVDERPAQWERLYVSARDALNRTQTMGRRGGPLIAKVRGATP